MSNRGAKGLSPMVMRSFAFGLVILAAACGSKQKTGNGSGSGSAEPAGVVQDTRTEIEKRRDAACDELAPRMTQCALDDAKAALAAGKVSQADFDRDTAPGVLAKNTDEAKKACKVQMSSRQVRVLEVCSKEESECGPLQDCLGHLNDGGN
jgi:hypothetical protein